MTGSELCAARNQLGSTPRDLAFELGLSERSYAALEARGARQIPKRYADHVAYRLAVAEQQEALAASGLPECAEMERLVESTTVDSLEDQANLGERLQQHVSSCAACQARERFIQERFPNMPQMPMPLWLRVLGGIAQRVDAFPGWLRPAIWGALALMAMTSVRVLFMLLAIARAPRMLLLALGAVLLAGLGGAMGGLVYSFLGRPLRRVPVAGPYLAGIVSVAGYLLSIGGLLAVAGEEDFTSDPGVTLVAFVLFSVVFGCILGHQAFRPKKSEPYATTT